MVKTVIIPIAVIPYQYELEAETYKRIDKANSEETEQLGALDRLLNLGFSIVDAREITTNQRIQIRYTLHKAEFVFNPEPAPDPELETDELSK